MISTLFKVAAGTVASAAFAAPSFAGTYANVETNAGFSGSDYSGAQTDLHIGYETTAGNAGFYVQGGPALISTDGEDGNTEFSGKAGVNVAATDALGVYGEISFLTTDDDNNYGLKGGVKYNFW